MQEKIGDPGANTSLKLALQGSGVGNQLRCATGSAGWLKELHSLASQYIGNTCCHTVDPRFVPSVVSERHSFLVFSDRMYRREAMQPAELRTGIFSKNPAKD